MSHLKERSEKKCLNCDAEVQGRYCHVCGQENIVPEETAWHLVTHFFNDITHFDGKFFSTLKYLIIKPGFLSSAYKAGRRASYLNPIRMYVFTSAIFFLIFFSVNSHMEDNILKTTYGKKTLDQIDQLDSVEFRQFTATINNGKAMTRAGFRSFVDSSNKSEGIHFTNHEYKTKAAYDSLLRSGKKDHNWFQRQLIYKEIEINQKYKNDTGQIGKIFISILIHSFPQMLFISLPLFALLLKLLYFRRKQFYYASHAIFSIHLYIFVFIMMLLVIALQQINNHVHLSVFNYLKGIVFLYVFYYQYKAMRNFYRQRRAKTIMKYFLLNFLMLIVIVLLFVAFTFFSLFKI